MSDRATRVEAVLRAAQSAKEGRRYEEALAHIYPLLPELRDDPAQWKMLAEFLLIGGVCLYELGKLAEAEESFKEGLKLQAEHSETASANFIYELSLVALKRGDIINARKLVQEAIDCHLQNAVVVARTGFVTYLHYNLVPVAPMLCQLALLDQQSGDYPSAIRSLELARTIAERSCSVDMLGVILNELGLAQIGAGQFGRGMKSLVESVRIKRCGDGHGIATTLANIQNCINFLPEFRAHPELPRYLVTLQRLLDR